MDSSEERPIPGTRAGDQVGLGRVVENRASIGTPDDEDPGTTRTTRGPDATGEPAVDDASEASFPASDPPTFMSDAATPRERDRPELPPPDDVP